MKKRVDKIRPGGDTLHRAQIYKFILVSDALAID